MSKSHNNKKGENNSEFSRVISARPLNPLSKTVDPIDRLDPLNDDIRLLDRPKIRAKFGMNKIMAEQREQVNAFRDRFNRSRVYHRNGFPSKVQSRFKNPFQKYFDRISPTKQLQIRICRARRLRKAILFALKVAGKNRRRSPGRGGGYKRSEYSNIKC